MAPDPLSHRHVLPIAGTLGQGMEYRHDVSERVKWRFAYHVLDESRSDIRRSMKYDLNLNMLSHPLILDWHPFAGRFRASTGVVLGTTRMAGSVYSNDSITNSGLTITGSDVHRAASSIDPTQVFSLQEWSINGAEVIGYAAMVGSDEVLAVNGMNIPESDLGFLSATVRYPNVAPYLGFGWGNAAGQKANWLYSIDIGVMYLGRPKVDLSLNGPVGEAANRYYFAETEAYLSEEQQKIENSLQNLRYFPVFSITLWYRF
ncbi:MAG: hypothetical protein OEM83_00725 [Gammaproteobacteria bacterium]|nr:hypothetical protein [Gammaproteobacteria bacterium]